MAELTRRYVVMPLATPAPFDPRDPDAPFVLKPWKDPAALRALRAYRDNCYPELARDLDEWIRLIEAGRAIRGDVGRRNERHLDPPTTDRRPSSQRPAARRPSTRRASAKPKRRR